MRRWGLAAALLLLAPAAQAATLNLPEAIAPENRNRILLHVHGGCYVSNPGESGTTEAISMAHFGKAKVIAIDYRMAPDHVFPAALDDVMAVLKATQKTTPATNIGVLGTSAGGALVLSMGHRAKKDGAPMPGAIVSGMAVDAFMRNVEPLAVAVKERPQRFLGAVLLRVGIVNKYIVPLPSQVLFSLERIIMEEKILSRVREAERDVIYNEFEQKLGEIVSGTVQRFEGDTVIVNLGRNIEGILPRLEKVRSELTDKLKRPANDDDVFSHLMYPQVFADFARHQATYSDVSVLPTPARVAACRRARSSWSESRNGTFIGGLRKCAWP